MKIYFSGSIYGGRQKIDAYKKLINELSKYGEVLDPEVADDTVIEDEANTTDYQIFDSLIERLHRADVVFAEWTVPSLGTGYEMGYADKLGKRIIGIYDKTITPKITTMFRGNKRLTIIPYSDLDEIIGNLGSIISKDEK